MRLNATQVQLESDVVQTSVDIRRGGVKSPNRIGFSTGKSEPCYQDNIDWRLFPKEWIYRNIPIEGKDVLDFGCGCGTGEITTQLAFLGARRVYALDVTPGLLDATRRHAELDSVADRVEIICGMVQSVEPRPVDVIIAYAVLHHCFPIENFMPELLRWLKPGGIFVARAGRLFARSWVAQGSLRHSWRSISRVLKNSSSCSQHTFCPHFGDNKWSTRVRQ